MYVGFAALTFVISVFLFYAFTELKTSSEHFMLAFLFLALHFATMNIVAGTGLKASHCTYDVVNETKVDANVTEYSYGETCDDKRGAADAFYYTLIVYSRIGFAYCFFYTIWRVLGVWGRLPRYFQKRYDRRYK